MQKIPLLFFSTNHIVQVIELSRKCKLCSFGIAYLQSIMAFSFAGIKEQKLFENTKKKTKREAGEFEILKVTGDVAEEKVEWKNVSFLQYNNTK